MLSELHKAGYQRIRAMPAMSPSGTHWRYTIAPAAVFHANHGAFLSGEALEQLAPCVDPSSPDSPVAYWSTGYAAEGHHFGWVDAAALNARELAAKFVERFPRLASLGFGWDYAYAGWHLRLLGLAEHGWLPIALDDLSGPSAKGLALMDVRPPQWRKDQGSAEPFLPLPPAGDWPIAARLDP